MLRFSSSSATMRLLPLLLLWILALAAAADVGTAECSRRKNPRHGCRRRRYGVPPPPEFAAGWLERAHVASIDEYGAVGDGATLCTDAFRAAVVNLSQYADDGGAMLVVPEGRYLTGPFNLTSHFTLFLHDGAVILASQELEDYPIIDPLPSYGRGRDLPGGRYSNFIMGTNLTDVAITGQNGTIDGQGQVWWDKFHAKELNHTRGYLLELMYCDHVFVSNLTFLNASSWFLHPVYSSDLVFSSLTILAPTHSPNTDGIDPDSSSNVRIEDCFIVSGDDCVAIKSGWDEYGIAFNLPSQHILIRNLTCISPTSAVIALGSEMSGGIRDVRAEDIFAINSESGVRIKTAVGRGGYVRDVFVRRMFLHTMKWVFWMTGTYGDHPDANWDPAAVPVVEGISYSDVAAENVTMVAKLEGIPQSPFAGICISNVTAKMATLKKPLPKWNCTNVKGVSTGVIPAPCEELAADNGVSSCPFPEDTLPMEGPLEEWWGTAPGN